MTSWTYDPATGLYTAKRYHDGSRIGYAYAYVDNSRRSRTTWARGVRRETAYDAENRLVSVRPLSPTEGALAVVNAYDHRHRRVVKRVERFDGDGWRTAETHRFVYDGCNIVLELIASADGTTRSVEYFWGNDLSGTEQGAGGVGGLLAVSAGGVFYFPCYDHNGNVVGYVSESGVLAAQYVYDPYGNVIEHHGDLADAFAFRFSTKYYDRETGMVGYQRRFYRPDLGRWLNRDPIEEEGGENLYAFCGNNLICGYDALGLWSSTSESSGDKRRVYKKANGDTIKGLANKLGMDAKTFCMWARIESGPKIVAEGEGQKAPNSDAGMKDVCYVSVPNVWIEADLLRGGGIYDQAIVNWGGTIGSFFGQTLGRWGYCTVKPTTPDELLHKVKEERKNVYGFTVYAHGSPNGYIIAPRRKSAIHQTSLISEFNANGYRIAKANLMQCYSIIQKGTIELENGAEGEYNYKAAWEKTAVRVYGYEGVNAFGVDF